MEKTNKAFTIRIMDNETGNEEVINTDAIIGGYVEGDGSTAFHHFHCNGLEVCCACAEALRAVEAVFDEYPKARALVTMLRAKSNKRE